MADGAKSPLLKLLVFLLCVGLVVSLLRGKEEPIRTADQRPHYELLRGTEYLWQRPKATKGILFLAHGCNHGAVDWWDKSEICPKCIGLPEEKRIVQTALDKGYLPLAISSQDRDFSRCWTEDDIAPVIAIVKAVKEQLGLGNLPVFALGASSGGAFLPLLAHSLNLTAMAVQIMATHSDLLSPHFPPTAFIHMPRDARHAHHVENNVQVLRGHGVTAHDWRQRPLPLTPTFLSDRVESITPALSDKIYQALRQAGYLTDSGELKEDPRESGWRGVLEKAVPETRTMNLRADESSISEELNVAWAMHEITSEFMTETLKFFDEVLAAQQEQKS